ncbi:hypothetical protein AMS68_006051 [Peltaster fructicola]|uniref:Uncharacterized protein n=1 Tax=Peltaster fructicola TaxID=286661 RepID=A0A6H0Y0K1_9PEZI|nr:hypothetical protein AMS68_006051 [Peltaster fructicola]
MAMKALCGEKDQGVCSIAATGYYKAVSAIFPLLLVSQDSGARSLNAEEILEDALPSRGQQYLLTAAVLNDWA